MRREESAILSDMIDSIEKLLQFSNEFELVELENDWKLQDVVVRRFEIIGEASSRITKEIEKLQ